MLKPPLKHRAPDVAVDARVKLLKRDDIAQRLAAERTAGRIIVFTNGVFDVLHIGHVRYLEFARSLGDILVVGVNADSSARELNKGPGRPLVPQAERAEIVAALESVTYVCIFEEQRPNETIRILRPHIHVKDSAYQGAELPEAEAVRAVGAAIRFAPRVEGRSTSEFLQRIAAAPETRA